MSRRVGSFLCNLFIVIMVPAAWCRMVFRQGAGGALTSAGWSSLKYFTVLSNLFVGAASLFYMICLAEILRKKRKDIPVWVHRLKYVATAAVALTFLTVMGFLGPVFGYSTMFLGANFWFHLIIPLVAMLEFCLFDTVDPLPFRSTFLAVIPMLVYGGIYLGNNLINGVGEGYQTNDWYGFLYWGLPVGLVIFAVLALVTWLVALILYGIAYLYRKRAAAKI